jgi:sarcosine oxidase, subunit beta
MANLRTDVLVIGGGIAGTATTYYLARAGVEVTLVDRLDLNTQASGSNAGSLHLQIPFPEFISDGEEWARVFTEATPVMREAIRLWRGLETELGVDLEVSIDGGLLVAETEAQMRDIARKAEIERAAGLTIELLSAGDLRRMAPYLSERMIGAAYCPDEGKANPLKATPAFAAAAQKYGARILANCEVTALVSGNDGYRANTPLGEIKARRIVNAAGVGAGRIAAMLGIELRTQPVAIQVNVTEPAEPLVNHLVYSAGGKLTLKQAKNGSFIIGGGWPALWSARAERPGVNPESLRNNLRVARHVVPRLDSVCLLRAWPAVVNGTPDWKPILGELPGRPGAFMSLFPWMGFTAGPMTGLLSAELVLGRKPSLDVAGFSASRF